MVEFDLECVLDWVHHRFEIPVALDSANVIPVAIVKSKYFVECVVAGLVGQVSHELALAIFDCRINKCEKFDSPDMEHVHCCWELADVVDQFVGDRVNIIHYRWWLSSGGATLEGTHVLTENHIGIYDVFQSHRASTDLLCSYHIAECFKSRASESVVQVLGGKSAFRLSFRKTFDISFHGLNRVLLNHLVLLGVR